MKARKRGRVRRSLLACRLAGLSALGAYYAGVRARAVRADAVPQRVSPVLGTMRFSQTRQGAFLPTPPAPPQRPPPRAQKRPDRAQVTAAERRNGRGPSNRNNAIELPFTIYIHITSVITIRSSHIFNRGISGDN
jgi:hypothetical protein